MAGGMYRFTIYVDSDTVAALSWLSAMVRAPKMYLGGELLKRAVEQAVNELHDKLEQELLDMDEERTDQVPEIPFEMLDDEPDYSPEDVE
jgi:hypothetical protein